MNQKEYIKNMQKAWKTVEKIQEEEKLHRSIFREIQSLDDVFEYALKNKQVKAESGLEIMQRYFQKHSKYIGKV